MTHLSDFSFLRKQQSNSTAAKLILINHTLIIRLAPQTERAIGLTYVFCWFLYRIQTTGGFECLYYSKFRRGELKSIVTALILVMIPFQLYYGNVSSYLLLIDALLAAVVVGKSGLTLLFVDFLKIDIASCKVKYEEGYVQILGHIVTKPEFLWTQADRDLVTPTGKVSCTISLDRNKQGNHFTLTFSFIMYACIIIETLIYFSMQKSRLQLVCGLFITDVRRNLF